MSREKGSGGRMRDLFVIRFLGVSLATSSLCLATACNFNFEKPSDSGVSRDPAEKRTATASSSAFSVLTGFTLVSAAKGTAIAGYDPIAPGAAIPITAFPAGGVSIRANYSSLPASVLFALDSGYTHTENNVPFDLCNDNNGAYIACTNLTVGQHTLRATPYSGSGASGSALAGIVLSFSVTAAAVPTPAPVPVASPPPVVAGNCPAIPACPAFPAIPACPALADIPACPAISAPAEFGTKITIPPLSTGNGYTITVVPEHVTFTYNLVTPPGGAPYRVYEWSFAHQVELMHTIAEVFHYTEYAGAPRDTGVADILMRQLSAHQTEVELANRTNLPILASAGANLIQRTHLISLSCKNKASVYTVPSTGPGKNEIYTYMLSNLPSAPAQVINGVSLAPQNCAVYMSINEASKELAADHPVHIGP